MKRFRWFFSFWVVISILLCTLPPAGAAEESRAIVVACSDFQAFADSDDGDYSGSYDFSASFVDRTLQAMGYSAIDGFLCGGDYNFADTSSSRTKTGTGIQALVDVVQNRFPALDREAMLLIQGNHDAADTPGMAETGGYDFPAYSVFVINEDDYMDGSNSSHSTVIRTGEKLEAYLAEKDAEHYDHPIFVIAHIPLHFNTRTQRRGDAKYAHHLFDPLNEYAKRLNIIYLFGHNHARGYDSYLGGAAVFLPRGDQIQVAVSGSKSEYTLETLNFTYMNYGYTGYVWFNHDSHGEDVITEYPPVDHSLTMTSFEIVGNTVTIHRWDENGLHNLKGPGKKITTEVNGLSYYDTWDANPTIYGPTMVADDPDAELEHDYQPVVTSPTCTEGGYTTYTCTQCGESYIDHETAALGHELIETHVEATCTTAGTLIKECSRCEYTEISEIAALGHDNKAVITAPTCTEGGYTTYTCTRCGESYIDHETAALGHNLTQTRVEATCTTAGTLIKECSRCDYREVAEIAAHGHDYVNGKCTRCNAKDPDDVCNGGEGCPSKDFADAPKPGSWAHAGIDYCIENALMNGVSDGIFHPNDTVTRGQLVTILYRMAGAPEFTNAKQFSDVEAGRYYTNAILWAAENGIVTGYNDHTFKPNVDISREQIAAILYRYAHTPTVTGTLDFPDSNQVSHYAKDALIWATQQQLITGIKTADNTILSPKSNATRAQIATMIMRYLKTE